MMFSKSAQIGRFKKKSKSPKVKMEESDLQNACEEYLQWNRIKYVRIPSVVYRIFFCTNPDYMGILFPLWLVKKIRKRVAEVFKGVPDLIVLGTVRYYCIELKTKSPQSEGQQKWQRDLPGDNYYIVSSLDEMIRIIKEEV